MPDEPLNVGDVASEGGFQETDKWDPETRKYIENLRRESAGYRERAKRVEEYDKYFGQYDDADRQVWFGLAEEMKKNPKNAAEYMRQISDGIMKDYEQQVPAAQQNPNNPNYITMEQFTAWQEQQVLDAEVQGIEREATALGYSVDSREYISLLWTAQHQTGGDLRAAHQQMQEQNESKWNEYISAKTEDAGRVGRLPGAASGASPSGQRELKTWADAQRALEARIAAAEGSR